MTKKSKLADSVGKQIEDQVVQTKFGPAGIEPKSPRSVNGKEVTHGKKGDVVAKKKDLEEDVDLSAGTSTEGAAEPIVLAQADAIIMADAGASSSSAAGAEAGAAGGGAAGGGAAAGAAAAGISTAGMIAIGAVVVGAAAASSGGGGGGSAGGATADTAAPTIQSMSASGSSVVLTYSEALDAVNVPANGTFTVTVNGTPNVVTNVAVSGTTVTLTLTSAVATGAAVQVVYTDPTAGNDANAIQDAAGNDAVSFTTGVVADGYIRGAQIYIDTNSNGVADASELLTGVVTNANGNYILPAGTPAGVIIATGGVNIDTGVPNTLVLKAPAGSTIVSPLTTLVQAYIVKNAGTSVADASATIVTSLGLAPGTNLTTYDPLAVLAAAPADSTALDVQRAAVQVATIVTLAAVAPAGTTTSADAAAAVITNLVTQIGAVTAPVLIDLTDATVGGDIEILLGTASTAVAATIATATIAIAAAGTLTLISTAQSVALDTISPARPTAVALAAASDTGSSSTDNLTNDSTPAVRVSFNTTATDGTAAVIGNTVNVYADGPSVGTATLTSTNIANGYADVTLSAQVDGAYTFTATIADIVGNVSGASAASPSITLETVVPAAPTVALITDSGAADLVTNVGTLVVTGTETGATVQYSTDAGTTWGGSFTAAEGANTVQVRQVDVAGNPSTAASITFTLDTTIATPTVALTTNSGSTADSITNGAALTFSTAATDVTRTYTVDSGTPGSTYTPLTTPGAHTVMVTDTDTAGNTANASITFTLDTAAPTLSSSAPVDGAIDVVGSSIVLTFGEAVAAGTGNIVISGGTTPLNILVTDTTQVAISGSTVTITPTTAPAPATAYTVTIASGVITDVAGNAFAGIASGGLDFTMADLPTVTITTAEADNLLNIGDSASITFTLSAASTDFASTDVTVSGGTLSGFSGSGTTYTATLTPTASSTANATVSVAQGAFTSNSLGNLASSTLTIPVDTVAPATPTVALTTNSGSTSDSITNSAALTFSTADGTRSVVVDGGTASGTYTAPTTDGSHTVTVTNTDAAGNTANASITFTLDTTIATPTVALTTNSGSTSDSITNSAALTLSTAATDVTRTYTVDSGTASGTYTAPTAAGAHTVMVTDTDTAGNTANASITFTLDTVAPTLSSSAPVDGAVDVVGSSIVLTFGEAVAVGTGNIVVTGGGQTFNPTVGNGLTINGSTVTIDGSDALPSTAYTVTIASGVFTDVAGNAYAGNAGNPLNFTTAAAPTLTSTIDNVANLDVTSNIVLTASSAVTKGTGFIRIVNDANDVSKAGFHGETTTNTQTVDVTSGAVSIANNTITINPGFDLDLANNYHIEVDAGAFMSGGVGSVAVTGATAMNFSTVTPNDGLLGVANAVTNATSQAMDSSGTLVASYSWMDIEGVGNPSAASGTVRDLSGGNIAMVFRDYDETTVAGGAYDGIGAPDFFVSATNFGAGDLLYVDNQLNTQPNSLASTTFLGDTPSNGVTEISFGTGVGSLGGLVDVTPVGAPTPSFVTALELQTLLSTTYIPIISA